MSLRTTLCGLLVIAMSVAHLKAADNSTPCLNLIEEKSDDFTNNTSNTGNSGDDQSQNKVAPTRKRPDNSHPASRDSKITDIHVNTASWEH